MIWGSRVSGALRSFDPWISGWHPGSVSSGGESELCHRDGARLLLPPIRGHLPPPILHLSHGVVQNSSSLPSCIIQVCQGRQQDWVYLVIFSIIYDLDHPEKARGSAHVVRRLSVRSATRSPSTRPHVLAIMRECVQVSTSCPPRHPPTLSNCPPNKRWADQPYQHQQELYDKMAFGFNPSATL